MAASRKISKKISKKSNLKKRRGTHKRSDAVAGGSGRKRRTYKSGMRGGGGGFPK